MSIAKNIEISSTSTVSFEDAVQKGIAKVSESVKNVKGAWIKEQKVGIEAGKIVEYNVMMIISFVVGDTQSVDQ
ncbi:MAG: dodecin family protein [Flavobacteriales bacterium]